MNLGIVGHAQDKFCPETEFIARQKIDEAIDEYQPDNIVSGHCPLGGVDIYAEEIALKRGISTIIHKPKQYQWDAEYGFKQRNLDIVKDSDVVIVIVVRDYPDGFSNNKRKFTGCYHCGDRNLPHVKSGSCWSGWQAMKLGKVVRWVIIE